jgi:hypothetical protein
MQNYLFPHRYKAISGWIFYLTCIIGLAYLYEWIVEAPSIFEVTVPNIFRLSVGFLEDDRSFWITNNIIDEVLIFLVTISGLVNSFSAEPVEDEFIAKMRYDALVWSLFVNSGLLLFATAFIYGTTYFSVMGFFLVSILLFFNLKFKYMLYKHYRS